MNETESRIQPSTDILSIAGWKIHRSRNLIEKGDQSVRLQPRTMAVLIRLFESPGEVVTRKQLEGAVWPNMVVGYDALSHTITKLRKAFGDDPKNPRLIETIPRVGYRLIVDVSRASPTSVRTSVAEESSEGPKQPMPDASERRLRLVGIAALLIMVGIGIAWWQPWALTDEPVSAEQMASPPSYISSNDAAHDAYLQGISYYSRNTPADNAKSEAHFKRAIELDPDFKSAYAALAKVYYKGIDVEFSNALLLSFRKAMFLAYKNLSKSVGANSADEYILRSRIALTRHQVEIALREVDRALELRKNDVDALNTKASALIFSGQYESGRKIANRILQLDSVIAAEPLYITGLSYFATGNYARAAESIERALESGNAPDFYNLLLASTYGKLGMNLEAKEALQRFRVARLGPFWTAAAVFLFPFEDGDVLGHLADGLESAGVVARPPSRYLDLSRKARLTGREIEMLLFGHAIKGTDFLIGSGWSQYRTASGKVSHRGAPIHIGTNPQSHNLNKGESWIDGDRLCNRWFDVDGDITSCTLVFRDVLGDHNDYYMVTEYGPNRFRIINQ